MGAGNHNKTTELLNYIAVLAIFGGHIDYRPRQIFCCKIRHPTKIRELKRHLLFILRFASLQIQTLPIPGKGLYGG